MTRSIRIIPAVLTDSPETLNTLLKQAESFTDYIQIDIMDGEFVPSRSITWEQIAGISTKLTWEAHLMVEQPEKHLEHFKKAGARKIIFHYEAAPAPEKTIAMARNLGIEMGLAVNPETPVSRILPLVGNIDSVLFLSVHPGFYGAKFIPEVLGKISELRLAQPALKMGIDGGIKESNIAQIASSGVDEICVGSAIFNQPQPAESYRKLLALARGSG
jgi:ribulose-phosphate 3-epimerase